MTSPRTERHGLPEPLRDAVEIVIILCTSLHDWHQGAFDTAVSDLLLVLRRTPLEIGQVRNILEKEFNRPHDSQWRVSANEYERRKSQVFLALGQLYESIINTSGTCFGREQSDISLTKT